MNIIKSDEMDETYDHEQSDIVSILMNMGFFHDYVIERFTMKLGFSKDFKRADDQHKIG